MSDNRTPEEVQADNFDIVMDRGPGLYIDMGVYIVARDPAKGRVLLGGLGCMGVGQMWQNEAERHVNYSGYADAPIQESPDREWWQL